MTTKRKSPNKLRIRRGAGKPRLVPVAGKVEPAEAQAVEALVKLAGPPMTRSQWVASAIREKLARAA